MRPFPFVQRKPATSDGRNGGPNCQLSSGRGEGPSIESVPLWSVVVKHWKKEQFWPFFGCCTLIHRLTQADISCTTTTRLFFFVWWSFRRRTKRGPRMVTSHTFFLYKNNFGRQQVQLLARCGFWKMLLGVCIEVTPLFLPPSIHTSHFLFACCFSGINNLNHAETSCTFPRWRAKCH